MHFLAFVDKPYRISFVRCSQAAFDNSFGPFEVNNELPFPGKREVEMTFKTWL